MNEVLRMYHNDNLQNWRDMKADVAKVNDAVTGISKRMDEQSGGLTLAKWMVPTLISLCGILIALLGVILTIHFTSSSPHALLSTDHFTMDAKR